ncbi:MAG: hypothetical protein ICV83_24790 [Cytophagales bacterium]|nr:hypothetical protein [Cytophagales bacterium]
MKTVKTIRTQLACLGVAACCAVYLASCNRDRPEGHSPRKIGSHPPRPPDDRFAAPDAGAAREREQFEQSMRETADAFWREMLALEGAVAQLPAPQRAEVRQRLAEVEQMLAAFRAQIAGMEKAGATQWPAYRKAVLGSSLYVKGHLNRAAEGVAPAEGVAGSQ